MQRSLREDLALRGYDLVFEYKDSTIAINTKEFTKEKEEVVYQKYGLKTLRSDDGITLYNPEVWKKVGLYYSLGLVEDCLAPEQPFFVSAPGFDLGGFKDLRHWDVTSARSLNSMFSYCDYLKGLLLDGWDVSNVEDAKYLFYSCNHLRELSLNGWDVSGIKSMDYMFALCSALERIHLDGWCINECTSTEKMFYGCQVGVSVKDLKSTTSINPCSAF